MKTFALRLIERLRRFDRVGRIRAELEALKRECKLVVPVSPDVILTRFEGFILSLPARDHGMVASYVFSDNIEQGFRLLFRQKVREGMTVIDVGAHIGIYTLISSSLVGPHGLVFSFEPTPSSYELLQANVGRTAFRHVVSLFPRAVTDRHGAHVSFALSADSSRNNSIFFDAADGQLEFIEVETVTLDQAIPTGQRVDVVKIDAEGAEPAVVRGMRRILEQNQDILLFMEYAPEHIRRAGESVEDFLQQLSAMGFHFYTIRDFEPTFDAILVKDLLNKPSANLMISRRLFETSQA